jgi:hypothetical protein
MGKIGGEEEILVGPSQASPIVKCDVCGQHYNRRYLSSHKRLSHGKRNNSALRIQNESKAVQTIVDLYLQLSATSRRNVIDRLASVSSSEASSRS